MDTEPHVDGTQKSDNGSDVDLVNVQSMSIFMYTDDMTYVRIPDECKHYTVLQHTRNLASGKKPQHHESCTCVVCVLQRIVECFLDERPVFSLVDVGCQYGIMSIAMANFIKHHKLSNRIFAFDCGIAGDLTPYNIKLNLVEDVVTFERKAVSNASVPQQVYYADGHSEDNHVARRASDQRFRIVDGITLDDYFAGHEEQMIIKIDAQGTEPLIFEGMPRLLQKNPVVVAEFVPWVVDGLGINPAEFVKKLMKAFDVFALEEGDDSKDMVHGSSYVVEESVVEKWVDYLRATEDQWCNIVIVPRAPGVYENVKKAMQNACGGRVWIPPPSPVAMQGPTMAPIPHLRHLGFVLHSMCPALSRTKSRARIDQNIHYPPCL